MNKYLESHIRHHCRTSELNLTHSPLLTVPILAVPVELWLNNAAHKQNWVASASSSELTYPPSLAIDGLTNNVFKSGTDEAFPWMQVRKRDITV